MASPYSAMDSITSPANGGSRELLVLTRGLVVGVHVPGGDEEEATRLGPQRLDRGSDLTGLAADVDRVPPAATSSVLSSAGPDMPRARQVTT